jgi:UDP-N-acetylmuramate--alanine ligase
VRWCPDPAQAVASVVAEAQPGDLVLTLGAGDVWKLGDDVLELLDSGATVGGER